MIKYLSLFSGIGAFEKALQRLEIPYELVGYCEIDKYASKAYSLLHSVPESMNFGDITQLDETQLPDDIDLITYGFPCQDISLAGQQKGLLNDDGTKTRSGLFFDALRIIEHTQPQIAIAENVKNLTSQKFSEQFDTVLSSLENVGYNNYWKVLNAKECFRLMGFDDSDIDLLMQNGISNTQLYKMAGNSIVVNVLEFIFCQIFDDSNKIWV